MLKNKQRKKISPAELGKLQKQALDTAKKEFEVREFLSQNDDGSIQVVATGKRELKSITFTPEALNLKKEELQESILIVVNDALFKVRAANIELTNEVNQMLLQQVDQLKKEGRI